MSGRSACPPVDEAGVSAVLDVLHARYGYDFRQYARPTLARRLAQAHGRFGCTSMAALRDRLAADKAIVSPLISLLTVPVSDLFRDPAYYLAVRRRVVPYLKTYPFIKVWIAGCGTGEEAYSFAILFREEGLEDRTTFYATDINAGALEKAASGAYELDRMAGFTSNYYLAGGTRSLAEYYTAGRHTAIFDRRLSNRILFADHSLTWDAVFSEVHLVSCRNVLIYFQRSLQERALTLFRDALLPGGFLALGSKERLAATHAFTVYDRETRIYRRLTGREEPLDDPR